MATLEERLTTIEQVYAHLKHDNEELKQKIELHTIAIGALVNKAALESLNEKNDKIFQALITHDDLTNRQLAELREKIEVQVDGKIVGLQTEMRQRFEQQDGKIVGLQTEMRQRFEEVNSRFEEVNSRFEEMNSRFEKVDSRFEKVDSRFEAQDKKIDQILLLLTTLINKPE